MSSVFSVLLTVHLGIMFLNNQLDAQFFFVYAYFYSLHVSDSYVSIIRRINCIHTTSGNVTLCRWPSGMQVWKILFQTCIPDGHLHTVTHTRCRIDKINSPDDGTRSCPKHVENRNKSIRKRIVRQVGNYKDYEFSTLSRFVGNKIPCDAASPATTTDTYVHGRKKPTSSEFWKISSTIPIWICFSFLPFYSFL